MRELLCRCSVCDTGGADAWTRGQEGVLCNNLWLCRRPEGYRLETRGMQVRSSSGGTQTLLSDHVSWAIGLVVQSALHRSYSPADRLRRPLQGLSSRKRARSCAERQPVPKNWEGACEEEKAEFLWHAMGQGQGW